MEVLFTHCAGLDCHKQTVVVHRVLPGPATGLLRETRSFGTTTAELLRLSDWLSAGGVTHLAMESTGVYWKPIFNLLETSFNVAVLNAQHVKNVPGRKTDVKDAQWLAELLRHGLVQPSFIPPQAQRDLRDLTRERTNFVRQRATLANRVQKVLEGMNIKLGDVASDVLGRSGRAMLDALVAGQTDAAQLAELAQGKLRRKRAELEQALTGRVRAHHQFLLSELLSQIDSVDDTIARFTAAIERACLADGDVVALLDTIPGISKEVAEVVLAEIGTDMSRFPSAAQLAAWSGLVPGNDESAGKRRNGRIRKGDPWLRVILIQAALGATRSKGTYLGAQYRRLAARRGAKRAIVAVAHSLIVIIYHVIAERAPYRELGGDYFERGNAEAKAKRLVRRVEQLGYEVTLKPKPAA
ncbi:MAG TPA: IS110 family transposase [Chloroflexia bacterium]|nr:IS110 family transposase [Chloroflexia bacterium]